MIELSIIIPCYNEAGSLPSLLNVCKSAIGSREDIEIIFVNNGSSDNSQAIFDQLLTSSENDFAHVVNIPVNKGYGYGILQGLHTARGNVLAWTHADLQTDPSDVIKAFETNEITLREGTAIIKGKRLGRSFFDAGFTFGMSVFSSLMLLTWLSDINAQPKMFNKSFMQKMGAAPFDFSLDLYLLFQARKAGITILSYPVQFNKRLYGEAKGGGTFKGKIKLVRRTINYIFELKKNIKIAHYGDYHTQSK